MHPAVKGAQGILQFQRSPSKGRHPATGQTCALFDFVEHAHRCFCMILAPAIGSGANYLN